MSNGNSALKTLSENVVDLAEMEVLTFTGTLTSIIEEQETEEEGKKKAINWKALLEKALDTEGEIELVAATLFKIDGDTLLFFTKETSGLHEELKQAHLEAAKAAQNYRQGLIEAFADILGIKT